MILKLNGMDPCPASVGFVTSRYKERMMLIITERGKTWREIVAKESRKQLTPMKGPIEIVFTMGKAIGWSWNILDFQKLTIVGIAKSGMIEGENEIVKITFVKLEAKEDFLEIEIKQIAD